MLRQPALAGFRILLLPGVGACVAQNRLIHTRDSSNEWHQTTVLCVRKDGQTVLMADGQVTRGSRIVKPNVKKLRKVGETAVAGFAGTATDGLTLCEKLQSKLEAHSGQLKRAAVELAKEWRQDRVLRRLEATLIVADSSTALEVSGSGDVLEAQDGLIAIGSGRGSALAAARALIDIPNLDAVSIAKKAMEIASESCIYTNNNFTMEMVPVAESSETII